MTQGALTLASTYALPAGSAPYGAATFGNNVYVCLTQTGASGLAQLYSDPTTGALSQIGTNPLIVSTTNGPRRARVAPDGKNVYVAVSGYGDLYTFTRSQTDGSLSGSIRQTQSGTASNGVTNFTLSSPTDIDVSPDNAHVYLVNNGGGGSIVVYSRAANGALTPIQSTVLAGAHAVRCAPDGSAVYVVSDSGNTLYWYARDTSPASGTYGQLTGVVTSIATPSNFPDSIEVTDDGNFIYVACDSGYQYTGCFQRNTSNSTLTALAHPAQTADNNGGSWWIALSRDSGNSLLYLALSDVQKITQYSRNGDGTLAFLSPGSVTTSYYTAGTPHGSGGPDGIAVSPSNKFLFATNTTPSTVDIFTIDQGVAPAVSGVTISPTSATVTGGGTQQFTGTATAVGGASTAVTYSADGGSVNSSGLWTAPAASGAPQMFHVTATSTFDNTKTATATVTVPAKTATAESVLLVDTNGNALANLAGLKWAFFDQTTPNSFAAPSVRGANGSTDASGNFIANITGTTLTVGAIGWLTVTDSDGTLTQSPGGRVFSGPVQVS